MLLLDVFMCVVYYVYIFLSVPYGE